MNPFKSILNFFAQFFSVPKQKIEPIPKLEPVVPKVPAQDPPNISIINLPSFIKGVEGYFGKLRSAQVDGFIHIMRELEKQSVSNRNQQAYVFATAWHETNVKPGPMVPIPESGGESYLRKKSYYPYYGRGFVQLTWLENYKKYGIDKTPELALDSEFAAHIIVHGMLNGVFTGRKLSHYFTDSFVDPINARHIINGIDQATEIAGYYYKFLDALKVAQVKAPEVMA